MNTVSNSKITLYNGSNKIDIPVDTLGTYYSVGIKQIESVNEGKIMSGGRFDYMDRAAMNEIFGCCHSDNVPNVFEDKEISELIYDVFNLIHDYDWYASGDTSEEDYLRAKKVFKDKWLNGDKKQREIRLKSIVDEAVDEVRDELYKTIGVNEQEYE